MKKYFLIAITIFSLFWLGLKYYKYLNSIYLFDNQAIFEVYLDINENEIDTFFSAEPGTFDKDKHKIICKLPVTVPSYTKPINKIVQIGLENINCVEKYDKKKHTKYDAAELNNNNAVLMIVGNQGLIEVADYNLPIAGKVYASKIIKFDYVKGKINHLVISKNGIHEYCK